MTEKNNLQVKKEPRNSNIELLRIISMIMIVFHHFACHGAFVFESSCVSISRFWYNFIIMGGKIGVDIFVLISGYYLIGNSGKLFNSKKVLKFWGQIFFYSIVIAVIGYCISGKNIGLRTLIETVLPISFSKWWFASCYFVLYLIHPFLNKLLNALNKSTYQKLIVLLVILWSVIPTFTTSAFSGNSLTWFITLYSIAGYIRLYGLNEKFTTKHYLLFSIVFSILTYLSSAFFTVLGSKWSFFSLHTTFFYGQDTIPVLLTSLSVFMTFASLKINYSKWINIIASATFGVYLIHDNEIARQLLWIDLFKNSQYQNSVFLIPYSVIVVISVYICCTLIDLLRIYTVEKAFMSIVNRISEKILFPVKKIIYIVKNTIFGKEN